MAPIILYHSPASPFSRSVLLLMRYLKLDVEVKVMNLMEKEQFTPEFLKINPQHCVPTIDDDGFYLWESRAILAYLLESKAPELVPTSPKEKAIVNQRLHYELGGFTNKFIQLVVPIFSGQREEVNPDTVKELHEILFTIDEHYFPNGNEWIAGEVITTADFAYVATVSTLVALGLSLEKYPRLDGWLKRCTAVMTDYEEANEKGIEIFKQFYITKYPKAFENFH
ncbi:hypothetical protein PVAND_009142 [Polypedilum vanderplanki]|uniref:glutathione transferase n=1 Tax=Polypedilum vanderplanki TaxID=319348 RepID=A0A9J6CD71_POLVA|nr:hypothetical protein PVAND_009142 [Polypedilum vanderplanki]